MKYFLTFHDTFHLYGVLGAAGCKRGLFASRKTNSSEGFQLYYGPRHKKSQSQQTPSEGPKEHGNYFYHRNSLNHLYWPFLAKTMNVLSQQTSHGVMYIYKYLHVLFPRDSKAVDIFLCAVGILTMDFACTPHTDKNYKCDGFTDNFIARLNLILQCEHVVGKLKDEVLNAISFLQYWGAGVPTTCCYQYIRHDIFHGEDIEIYHYFCMQGLDMCRRLHNFWTHTFMAYCFVHSTSVPIYIWKGKAYIGVCPGYTMLAWGAARAGSA